MGTVTNLNTAQQSASISILTPEIVQKMAQINRAMRRLRGLGCVVIREVRQPHCLHVRGKTAGQSMGALMDATTQRSYAQKANGGLLCTAFLDGVCVSWEVQ